MDADIESFLIRLRVMFDELAFVIRSFMPIYVRHLSSPEGGVPANYKYFSFNSFLKYVSKYPEADPLLTHLVDGRKTFFKEFIEKRDDIIHFRAKAVVFVRDQLGVGFLDKNLDYSSGSSIQIRDLAPYVAGAITDLWNFMNDDMVSYFRTLIGSGRLRYKPLGIGCVIMKGTGVARLKKSIVSSSPHT